MRVTRSLSVESKLIGALVLLTLLAIGVVSWIGFASILVTRPVYERVRELVGMGPATRVDVRGMGPVELFSVLDEFAA
jgi:hypothetical protein